MSLDVEAVTTEMLILAMVLLKPQTSNAVKSQDYGFYGIA